MKQTQIALLVTGQFPESLNCCTRESKRCLTMISYFDNGQVLKILSPYKWMYGIFFMTKLILQFGFGFSIMKNRLFQSTRVATEIKNLQKELLLVLQLLNTDIDTWTYLHFVFQTSLILLQSCKGQIWIQSFSVIKVWFHYLKLFHSSFLLLSMIPKVASGWKGMHYHWACSHWKEIAAVKSLCQLRASSQPQPSGAIQTMHDVCSYGKEAWKGCSTYQF